MVEVSKAGLIRRLSIFLWLIATITMLPLIGTSAAQRSALNAMGNANLLKAFELGTGDAVFCYDVRPAFVFALTGVDGPHGILLVPFDGEATEIFNISGKILAGTLSCSDDGQTIAFVRENGETDGFDLFIVKSGIASQYHLSAWSSAFPIEGTTSLLSEDGAGIALPAKPIHVAGPDVIQKMHSFIYDGKPYFSNGSLIYDHGRFIQGFSFTGDFWKTHFSISKDPLFFIQQAGYCFGHTIAVGQIEESEDDLEQLYDLTHGRLEKVRLGGFSDLLSRAKRMKLGSLLTSASRYDKCIYAFANWESTKYDLKGFAIVERNGAHFYRIQENLTNDGDEITLANFRIGVTKDGCAALVSTYANAPRIGQNHRGSSHVLALRLAKNSRTCSK